MELSLGRSSIYTLRSEEAFLVREYDSDRTEYFSKYDLSGRNLWRHKALFQPSVAHPGLGSSAFLYHECGVLQVVLLSVATGEIISKISLNKFKDFDSWIFQDFLVFWSTDSTGAFSIDQSGREIRLDTSAPLLNVGDCTLSFIFADSSSNRHSVGKKLGLVSANRVVKILATEFDRRHLQICETDNFVFFSDWGNGLFVYNRKTSDFNRLCHFDVGGGEWYISVLADKDVVFLQKWSGEPACIGFECYDHKGLIGSGIKTPVRNSCAIHPYGFLITQNREIFDIPSLELVTQF